MSHWNQMAIFILKTLSKSNEIIITPISAHPVPDGRTRLPALGRKQAVVPMLFCRFWLLELPVSEAGSAGSPATDPAAAGESEPTW